MPNAILTAVTAMALLAQPLAAGASGERDQDRARAALQAGEILPLSTILDRVAREQPGQVLAVELERSDGRWVYELKLLQTGGALLKIKVDARDGEIVRRRPGRS